MKQGRRKTGGKNRRLNTGSEEDKANEAEIKENEIIIVKW